MTNNSTTPPPPDFGRQLDALRPLADINHLLHTLRGYCLGEMPRGIDVMLSAGCAGTWYFDWIEKAYARPRHHIGIEYFMPKPHDLPPYVEWVANTVGNMSDVTSDSVDLVFSGQNIEHLWPDDVAGFLLESHCVLKAGAVLVLGSPNRLVTRPLNWNHPQHTMESTPAEITQLLQCAGFECTCLRGLWTVRDPSTGELLPLSADAVVENWPFLRHVVAAANHADDAFLWWVEARKTERSPDAKAIRRLLDEICSREWPRRSNRFYTQGEVIGTAVARCTQPTSMFFTDRMSPCLRAVIPYGSKSEEAGERLERDPAAVVRSIPPRG